MSRPPNDLAERQLGGTNMVLSRVGLGGWTWGGGDWAVGWGPQDDRDSIATIQRAVDAGVNWLDTAAIYGLGRSEEVVGRALRVLPAERRPYVFTKCGLAWNESQPQAPPTRVGSAAALREGIEGSLRRLGVERIDLLKMHFPPEDRTPIDDYWQTLIDLKREGKVRAVGLSNHGVNDLRMAERLGHVDAIQVRFSLVSREAAADLLPWGREHGVGVLVYSPMQSGLLSGSFDAARAAALRADDWRSRNPEFSGRRLTKNLGLANALRPIAARHGTTVGAVAVAWTLSWPGVTCAIVGGREPNQIDGWIDAATLDLGGEDLREITAAIAATGAGRGPVQPADGARQELRSRVGD